MKPAPPLLRGIVRDIAEGYDFLVESLRRARPRSTLLVTTVYDPSDGTRRIPGVSDESGDLPLEALHELNDRIRAVAVRTPATAVADAWGHFMGHGVTAAEADRWYWKRSWIEPRCSTTRRSAPATFTASTAPNSSPSSPVTSPIASWFALR